MEENKTLIIDIENKDQLFQNKFSMDNVNILYNKLKKRQPFCFIKLNDGEIHAFDPNNVIISRGDEHSSPLLSEKIKECLNYKHKDYFIGLPCIKCNKELSYKALEYIGNNDNINDLENDVDNMNKYSNILNANILINTNVDYTIDILSNVLENIIINNSSKNEKEWKNIIVVSNSHNLSNIHKLSKLNIYPNKLIEVSDKFCFENDYYKIKDTWKTFNNNDIVICLCGPLGRILCYEWFKENNTLTCLELGSLFDPLLRNKSYLYHTGTHQYCEMCYPSHDAEDCLLIKMQKEPIEKECYYFYNETNPFDFYQNNIIKINKNNNIRLEKDPTNQMLLNIKHICYEKTRNDIKNIALTLNEYSYSDNDYNYDCKLNHYQIDSDIESSDSNTPFYIVYHIATLNDKWKILTQRSYNKLVKSGILYDKNLKGVKISFLGDETNIDVLKHIWFRKKVDIIHYGTDYKMYEYPAIHLIQNICKHEDCNILYFHCKGLLHKDDNIKDWIDYIEYFNIERYKHSISKLKEYDVVSCNYYPREGDPYYKKNPYWFTFLNKHYSGNYWWTKTSYVNTLKRLEYNKNGENDRYSAEFWICSNEEGRFWSYYTASINFGELNRHRIYRNNYYGLENFNLNFVRGNDYTQYSKHELFEKAQNAYNCRQLKKLDYICDVYLKYFIELNDEETHNIVFWSGFSNFNVNPKKAKQQFKILYNRKSLNELTEFYTKCNLDMLYNKNGESIPNVIHLIYFKGIEFMKFHYECVKSMIRHMPDYNIIIYNDIEPENNEYWNDIKTYKNVKVDKMDPPHSYDGYPLKYIQYKADVARLEILYKYGGIYLDLDMLIIKNFENIINTGKDFYISEEGESGGGLINSFLACKPNNGFIKKWLESFKVGLRMDNWAYHIRESNKQLLNKNKHYFIKYKIEILESKYFFPFKWNEREKFQHIKENLNEENYGIHLYETILKDVLVDNSYFDD
jgi:mannosyltransferase OCH1-like enzyme